MRPVVMKLANVSVLHAFNEIYNQPDLFDEFTKRQLATDSPHKETQTVPIRGIDLETANQDTWQRTNYSEDTKYAEMLPECYKLALDLMAFVRGKRLGAIMLVNLPPKKEIREHTDEGYRADYYQRFHIIIGGSHTWHSPAARHRRATARYMRDGQIWAVNNQLPHRVVNDSENVHRLALIVDIHT